MVVGCDGSFGLGPHYDFTGVWKGTVTSPDTPCSDGSLYPASSSARTITIHSGGDDQIYWEADCGNVYLTQDGSIATQVRATTCPPQTNNGVSVTSSMHDASLVMTGSLLDFDAYVDIEVTSSSITGRCNNIHLTGTLAH